MAEHLAADTAATWPGEVKSRAASTCLASMPVVEKLDQPRCPERAGCMKQALEQADRDALGGRALNFSLLAEWHKLACPGEEVRAEAWAFAKGGTERYSLNNELLDQRLQALESERPLVRAVRAYLDILFFHPFTDGNSRAARLAFHYFSTVDGMRFRNLDPLFRLSIPAGNARGYRLFWELALRLVDPPANEKEVDAL